MEGKDGVGLSYSFPDPHVRNLDHGHGHCLGHGNHGSFPENYYRENYPVPDYSEFDLQNFSRNLYGGFAIFVYLADKASILALAFYSYKNSIAQLDVGLGLMTKHLVTHFHVEASLLDHHLGSYQDIVSLHTEEKSFLTLGLQQLCETQSPP